jgi:hypothetical protein
MHLLPGVRRDPLNENFLTINTRIARILPLQIFHLSGFRRLRWTDKYLVVSRRSYDLVRPTLSKWILVFLGNTRICV